MKKQPASPQGSFLLGNLSQFVADPPQFLVDTTRQYGDMVRLRLANQTAYLSSHPDTIREVLVTKAASFERGQTDYRILSRFLGNGLLTSEGNLHKQQRKLVQPAFHTKRIQAYASTMVAYTDKMLADWQSGQIRDISDEMMRLTMFIVAKTLFDADVSEDAETVGQAIHDLQKVSNNDYRRTFPWPQWLPTADNRKRQQAVKKLDAVIQQIIAERRQSGEDRGDLLSMLLLAQSEDGSTMSNKQLRDEVVTLFAAGHDTTANTLTWTWYLLSQNPQVVATLHQELDEVLAGRLPELADLPKLPYTLMVIKESMRLYPPAWLIGRTALHEVEIGGYSLPKDSRVYISPYAIHRLPTYFPDPDSFDPERWLPEKEEALPKYAYIPFGGGPRVCIGNSFALMEAHLLLATIAQQFDLSLMPDQKVVPEPLITMSPEFGLRMRVQPRGAGQEVVEMATAVPQPISA